MCERKFGGVSNGVSLVSTFLVVYPPMFKCIKYYNLRFTITSDIYKSKEESWLQDEVTQK